MYTSFFSLRVFGTAELIFMLDTQLNDDRLNIPTTLSPVKEDELVPNRSTASAIHSFSGRRR